MLVCENNLYATATALSSVTLNPEIASRAAAYGIPGIAVDGNDVVAVWQAAREAVERARAGRRADPDRGEDLPHRRPPRGRSRDRHLPDAGGGGRMGQALPGRDLQAPDPRGLRDRHRTRARCRSTRPSTRRSRPRSNSPADRRSRSQRPMSLHVFADPLNPPEATGTDAAEAVPRSRRAGSMPSGTGSPRRCGATAT